MMGIKVKHEFGQVLEYPWFWLAVCKAGQQRWADPSYLGMTAAMRHLHNTVHVNHGSSFSLLKKLEVLAVVRQLFIFEQPCKWLYFFY